MFEWILGGGHETIVCICKVKRMHTVTKLSASIIELNPHDDAIPFSAYFMFYDQASGSQKACAIPPQLSRRQRKSPP